MDGECWALYQKGPEDTDKEVVFEIESVGVIRELGPERQQEGGAPSGRFCPESFEEERVPVGEECLSGADRVTCERPLRVIKQKRLASAGLVVRVCSEERVPRGCLVPAQLHRTYNSSQLVYVSQRYIQALHTDIRCSIRAPNSYPKIGISDQDEKYA